MHEPSDVRNTINVSNGAAGAAAINGSIWATLPAFFTYASTGTVIEWGGAARSSTDPTPGDTSPLWGYWDIPPGGGVLIPFTANVLSGIPPGTYDANSFASGDNFGPIDDDGPIGGDSNTPPGGDPEPDEDVTVRYTVGGIVEPIDRIGILAPWLGLAVLMAVAMVVAVLFKRRRIA